MVERKRIRKNKQKKGKKKRKNSKRKEFVETGLRKVLKEKECAKKAQTTTGTVTSTGEVTGN